MRWQCEMASAVSSQQRRLTTADHDSVLMAASVHYNETNEHKRAEADWGEDRALQQQRHGNGRGGGLSFPT